MHAPQRHEGGPVVVHLVWVGDMGVRRNETFGYDRRVVHRVTPPMHRTMHGLEN